MPELGRIAQPVLLVTGVVLGALLACRPGDQPQPPREDSPVQAQALAPSGPVSRAQDAPANMPLARIDVSALRAAAAAAAVAVGVRPELATRGRRLARPAAGKKRISGYEALLELPVTAVPYEVDWTSLFFRRDPVAVLRPDATLEVEWETREKASGGALFVGIRVEEDPLAAPRYRAYQRERRPQPSVRHAAAKSLQTLLTPKYDVNAVLERGYGEVAWQVEQIDPTTGSSVLHESRTAFRVVRGESPASMRVVQQPTVVLGPLVHQVSPTRFLVSFETDVPTAGAVAVGDGLPRVSKSAGMRHEVVVDGLSPGRRYRYQVAVSNGVETSLAPARIVQTPADDKPLTVAIFSDSRSGIAPGRSSYGGVNAEVLAGLLTSARIRGAQAVFFPGDLIDGYATNVDDYDHQLRTWLRVAEGVHGEIPIYTGVGNHEVLITQWSDRVALAVGGETSAEARFAAVMVNPGGAPDHERDGAPPYDETVYSVDISGVHFVMLNTNYWFASSVGDPRYAGLGNREGFIMERQMAWLEADLAAARKRGADEIVVMGHEPAFPVAGHTGDAMWWLGAHDDVNAMREHFWKVLAAHDVIAYVSGDEHNYSRSLIGPETVAGAKNSVYSVISGGCGAPYYALAAPPEYAARVQNFSAQQHYTLWHFERGKAPRLTVVGLSGNVIEEVVLDRGGQTP